MNQACGSPDDFSFGPAINSCHRGFDFTLFFEDTVLSLIPSSVFIPVSCVLIAILANKKPATLRTKWYAVKIVSVSIGAFHRPHTNPTIGHLLGLGRHLLHRISCCGS